MGDRDPAGARPGSVESGAEPKVAIIGAGIAGLCTGIYARMNGYAAHIYEMHSKPGGLCTAWDRKGYTVDACIHWFTGSRPGSSLYKIWHEVGVVQELDLIDLDEFTRVEFPEPGSSTIVFYTDLDRLEKHLVEIAPEDTALLQEFLGDAKRMAEIELPSDLPPREVMNLGSALRLIPLMPRLRKALRLIGKWNTMTIAEFTDRFQNPRLREALLQVWLPEMSAFVLLMTLAWFHDRQAGYPLGGSLPVARVAERRFLELGGTVDYRTRVVEILVENDRAVGVRLENGLEERFDAVISAADGHATIFDMLKGRYVDDVVRSWFEDYQPFPPLVFVGLGVNRSFLHEPRLVSGASLRLTEPIRIGNTDVERLTYHLHNYDPNLAPADKTAITCMLAVDYDYWKELSQDRDRYEAEKQAIGNAVVKTLDGRFPGLADLVEMVDVATPVTFERYTGNWRASFEGWLPTPGNLTVSMRKTLPGLDAFYMAGQWVAPGGGLPSGVASGREVLQLMCHRDKKRFRTSTS